MMSTVVPTKKDGEVVHLETDLHFLNAIDNEEKTVFNGSERIKIAAQSGIGNSIEEIGKIVQGSPALPIRDFKKAYVHFRKLDQIVDEVTRLSTQQKHEQNG